MVYEYFNVILVVMSDSFNGKFSAIDLFVEYRGNFFVTVRIYFCNGHFKLADSRNWNKCQQNTATSATITSYSIECYMNIYIYIHVSITYIYLRYIYYIYIIYISYIYHIYIAHIYSAYISYI